MGEGESLLVPTATTMIPEETQQPSSSTKKYVTRVGSALVVALIVAAFALRTEIFPQNSLTTYDASGAIVPSSSAAGNVIMQTGSPVMTSSSPIFTPEGSEVVGESIMIAANPEAAASEETKEVATAEAANAPQVVVVDDPDHPVVAKVKPVVPASKIRSDTRLSPLFMSRYTDDYGLLKNFFSKYGLVGNRLTDKDKYRIPAAKSTVGIKGDASTWAYATMYDGSTCGGSTVSVAGLAGQECIPVAGFGDTSSQAFMVDCDSTQIVINSYSAQDCSGAVLASAVLASVNTCYQYSSTMYENPTDSTKTDSSTSTSVQFSCGMPNLSGFDVQKTFITTDSSAESVCKASMEYQYDGQLFEAMPTEQCIPESLGNNNEYSVKFSKDAGLTPSVTYYFNSLTCDSDKTTSAVLSGDCADAGIQTGIFSYSKWAYHI